MKAAILLVMLMVAPAAQAGFITGVIVGSAMSGDGKPPDSSTMVYEVTEPTLVCDCNVEAKCYVDQVARGESHQLAGPEYLQSKVPGAKLVKHFILFRNGRCWSMIIEYKP